MPETPNQFDPSMFKTLEEMRKAFPEEAENFVESVDDYGNKGFVNKSALEADDLEIEDARRVTQSEVYKNIPEVNQRLVLTLLSEGLLSETEASLLPDDFSGSEIRSYADRQYCSWRTETFEIKSSGEMHYDVADAIQEAKKLGQNSDECDKLLKYFIHLTRYPLPLAQTGLAPVYPPMHTLQPLQYDENIDPTFREDNVASFNSIRSEPLLSLDAISKTIDHYKEYYFRSARAKAQEIKSNASKGIEIGETNLKRMAEDTYFVGETHHVEQEFLSSLYSFSKTCNPEDRANLERSALPVKNMRNILSHATGLDRLPIIRNTGILSHDLADRIATRKYGGRVKMTSGWGDPYIGTRYIDVWDPTPNADPRTQKPYAKVPGQKKPELVEQPKTLDYTPDRNFRVDIYGGSGKPFTVTLLIRLDPDRTRDLIRTKSKQTESGHTYVKQRIKPDEFIGIVIYSDNILIETAMLASDYDENKDYSRDELLEMVGANVRLPIYDANSNLIWPTYISSEDLLDKALSEKAP